jgi:hypothetical protein
MASGYKYKIEFYIIIGGVLVLGMYGIASMLLKVPNDSEIQTPQAGPIALQGKIVCLPHRDTSGPQTLECAFGLQDIQGRYFALRDSDPSYKNISGVGSDEQVDIEGNFTPQDDAKYQSLGVIEVMRVSVSLDPNTQLRNLPGDVFPEQIKAKYSVSGNLYAFAIENNANYHLQALVGKNISWHGVLRSKNNAESWEKFFTINDPANPSAVGQKIKYNPVGGFLENGKMLIDIANDQGAGSGEGQLIRFSTNNDGKTWQQEGCYYFMPERYYPDYNQGKTDTLSPHDLERSNDCLY